MLAIQVTNLLKGDLKDVKLMNVAERKLIVTKIGEQSAMLDNDKHKMVNASVDVEEVGEYDEGKFASMTLKDLVNTLSGNEREIVNITYDYRSTRIARKEQPKQVKDFLWKFSSEKTDEDSIKDLNRFHYERPPPTPPILSSRKLKPTTQQLVNSIKKFSPLTDRDFTELMLRLRRSNSSGKINLSSSDLGLKIVKVGDYMVPWNLAHILKELLAKRGDISGAESKLSIEMKSIISYLLCGVINSMCRTMFVDVTEDVLQSWFACLQIAKSNGFKIDFVYARLEGVMRAFFGLQTTRVKSDAVAQMDQMLGSLKQEILVRQAEMDKLLDNFESCMEYREKYRNSENSNFIKECLSEASMFTWKIVGNDLL